MRAEHHVTIGPKSSPFHEWPMGGIGTALSIEMGPSVFRDDVVWVTREGYSTQRFVVFDMYPIASSRYRVYLSPTRLGQ